MAERRIGMQPESDKVKKEREGRGWGLKKEGRWAVASGAKAVIYTSACLDSYLNPHPVPPRTIAARRIAPAMEPIMILVPLGPAKGVGAGGLRGERIGLGQEEEEGVEAEGREGGAETKNNNTQIHTSEPQHRPSMSTTTGEREGKVDGLRRKRGRV